MNKQWRVGILVFDYVDLLDVSGPMEVFSRTVRDRRQVGRRLTDGLPPKERPFAVNTISLDGSSVTADTGLVLRPDLGLDEAWEDWDILVVPGGPWKALQFCLGNARIQSWLRDRHKAGSLIASVCTGTFLLAEAGLLDGKKATTHPLACDELADAYPRIRVVRGERFVDEGRLITSGGGSDSLDMSLHLVQKLLGSEAVGATAQTLDYSSKQSFALLA